MPLQVFVQVTIPGALSIAPGKVGGYGSSVLGYGVGYGEYIGAPVLNPVQMADIYQALNAVRPVTGVFWTSITVGGPSSTPPPPITVDTTKILTSTTQITTDGGSA